jgi:hypothetical protein
MTYALAITGGSVPYIETIEASTARSGVPGLVKFLPSPNLRATPDSRDYATVTRDNVFGHHFAKLKAVLSDARLWPEGADAPQSLAVYWATRVLQRLEDDMIRPSRVVASADGGVTISFTKEGKYAHIECFNDGAILGAWSNRNDRPTVWEIGPDQDEIARSTARIREFLEPSAPKKNGATGAPRRQ